MSGISQRVWLILTLMVLPQPLLLPTVHSGAFHVTGGTAGAPTTTLCILE